MVRVNICIGNEEQNIKTQLNAIYDKDDKTITYLEEDELRTKVIFDFKTLTLTRENDSLRMNYKFNKKKKTIGKVYVKELDRFIEVSIKVVNMTLKDNYFDVHYILENQNMHYTIEVI